MKKIYLMLLGLLGLHLFLLTNLQFTAWPEIVSFPYLINHGFLIYKDFHHAYQPLLTLVLSLVYSIFGYKLLVLKIFTWTLILVSDILVFLIVKYWTKNLGASAASLAFYVFLQSFFEGNMLWFDLATVPLLLFSLHLFVKFIKTGKTPDLYFSGLILSLSILVKQQAALLIIAFLIYLLLEKRGLRKLWVYFLGGLTPVVLTLAYLLAKGVFKDYLFWTFLFPFKFLPGTPGYAMLPGIRELAITTFIFFPLLLSKSKFLKYLLLPLALAAFLSAFPRFSFFHLQPMIAVACVGYGVVSLATKNRLFLFFPLLAIAAIILAKPTTLFDKTTRFYGPAEFGQADYLRKNSQPTDKIYLLGPHSLIYVLSQRLPPKPWTENYVWHFEIPGMQEKLIDGFSKTPPEIIIWTEPRPGNWYELATYQPKKVTDWIMVRYTREKELSQGIWLWKRN